jgi:hypothetical protein
MVDVLEAIKSLDGYTEALVSLSALLSAEVFDEKGIEHEGLLVQIKEKQRDGRWIALSFNTRRNPGYSRRAGVKKPCYCGRDLAVRVCGLLQVAKYKAFIILPLHRGSLQSR